MLITADDGGIVNDPICLRLAEDHFWLSASDSDLWLYARGVNAIAGMDVVPIDVTARARILEREQRLALADQVVLAGQDIADLVVGEFEILDRAAGGNRLETSRRLVIGASLSAAVDRPRPSESRGFSTNSWPSYSV